MLSFFDCCSETKRNVVERVRLHRDYFKIDYYLNVNGFHAPLRVALLLRKILLFYPNPPSIVIDIKNVVTIVLYRYFIYSIYFRILRVKPTS